MNLPTGVISKTKEAFDQFISEVKNQETYYQISKLEDIKDKAFKSITFSYDGQDVENNIIIEAKNRIAPGPGMFEMLDYDSSGVSKIIKTIGDWEQTTYRIPKENFVKNVNRIIEDSKAEAVKPFEENQISDGYHTFEELYEFRKIYNALLFNTWARLENDYYINGVIEPISSYPDAVPAYDVHKSLRHNDGELCFGGGWFIVSAILPTGLISNHYKMKDWDLFKVPEVDKAKYEFDGHTGKDVLARLINLIENTNEDT